MFRNSAIVFNLACSVSRARKFRAVLVTIGGLFRAVLVTIGGVLVTIGGLTVWTATFRLTCTMTEFFMCDLKTAIETFF